MNTLYYGDDLKIRRDHIKDELTRFHREKTQNERR
jgi:hypothetical protein